MTHPETGISDRRAMPRRQCAPKDVVVWLDSKTPLKGTVTDESLRGIGMEFSEELEPSPALNQQVSISYNGVQLDARVRHIGRSNAGTTRVGFEWTADGFPQPTSTSTNSASEFFETLPYGLFVIFEFFENDKWPELGEAAERLQDLADRCGVTDLNASLRQLYDALELLDPREAARQSLNSLIEQCQRLKRIESVSYELDSKKTDEHTVGSAEQADPGPPLPQQSALVAPLLQSIAKTTNEITIQSLADGLRGVIPSLPQDDIETVFHQILAAMRDATNECTVSSLAGTLGIVVDRVPPQDAEVFFQRVVASLHSFDDLQSVQHLSSVLTAVAEKLPDDTAEKILEEIVAHYDDCGEVEQEMSSYLLETMAEKLSVEATARLVPRLIQTVQASDSENLQRCLTQILQLLADKMPAQSIQETLQQIVVAVEETTDEFTLQCLAQILSSLTERMPTI